MERAQIYQRANEHEKALADYEQAAVCSPNSPAVHQGMAGAYEAVENLEGALAEYTKAVKCGGSLKTGVLGKRMKLLYRLKKYKEALQDCEKVYVAWLYHSVVDGK